jgi:ABC-type hemin transport system substrate-binding protein
MNRKTYIDNFGRKLQSWDKDISRLEKKAEKLTKTLHAHIDELKEHRDHAATKTSVLLHSSEEAWVEVKYGAEQALNDMKKAFRKAKSKF